MKLKSQKDRSATTFALYSIGAIMKFRRYGIEIHIYLCNKIPNCRENMIKVKMLK